MKAIIVEDNPHSAQVIQTILAENKPEIEICCVVSTVTEAVERIRKEGPNLWFLDIRLKDDLVFSLFQKIDKDLVDSSAIIFITAYDSKDYPLQAIKSSALDFIYKPIDQKELLEAVDRAQEKIKKQDLSGRLRSLEEQLSRLTAANSLEKLPIFRINNMIDYVDTNRILYLESDLNTCRFFLTDQTHVISARSMASYKNSVIEHARFVQVSKKHIVNPTHIQRFDAGRQILLLDNGMQLEVSRRRNKDLKDFFRDLF